MSHKMAQPWTSEVRRIHDILDLVCEISVRSSVRPSLSWRWYRASTV